MVGKIVFSKNDTMIAAVSVVIPCYRCVKTVERACESVVRQTLKPRELILVEDCSNDAGLTIDKLRELKEKYKEDMESIIIIQNKGNRGPAVSRNIGWDSAGQPYIAFLDADDSWHPRKLEIQYTWMKAHPHVAITGHSTLSIQPDAPMLGLSDKWMVQPIQKHRLLFSNRFPTRSVMLRRDMRFRFDARKRFCEDYLLWLQIVLGKNEAYRFDMTLAYSYKADYGSGGLSKNLWAMEKGELDAYLQVYRSRMISLAELICYTSISLIKFVRRCVVTHRRVDH